MYEVIGFRYVDMTADDGPRGYSVFFAVDEDSEGLTGRSACKVFFPDSKFPDFCPVLGARYEVNFNQKGKLQGYRAAA